MIRLIWMAAILLFLSALSQGTTGYGASMTGPYFTISFQDFDHKNEKGEWHPTRWEEARDVARFWREAIRAHRAIDRSPASHMELAVKPLGAFLSECHPVLPDDLQQALIAHGITARMLARQSTIVYTVQIAAYRNRSVLRRYLRHLPKDEGGGWEGPALGIFSDVKKRVVFEHGGDYAYKQEPLYIIKNKDFTRLRFGWYENIADARSDAAAWEKRFYIKAIVVPVKLTASLVYALAYGELSGCFPPMEKHEYRMAK